MQILAGSRFADMATPPTPASSHIGEVIETSPLLMHTATGAQWSYLTMFEDCLVPTLSPRDVVRKTIFAGNIASGDVDLGTPPSGYRWKIVSMVFMNASGSSVSYILMVKIGGTYYKFRGSDPISVGTSNAAGTAAAVSTLESGCPILEYGEYFSLNTTAAGLNAFIMVDEFPTSNALKTAKLTSFSSGNNTIYTCPSGYHALATQLNSNMSKYANGNIFYIQATGSSRTVYGYHVKSGGSPSAAGVSSYSTSTGTSTVTTGQATNLPLCNSFEAGDFCGLNTDSSASGQMAWVTLAEFPLLV